MSKLPLVCPPRMSAGAQVGVVSPSSPSAGRFPRRFQRGLDGVEALGWRLKIGKSALAVTGHTAGDPDERAADINRMIADPDVSMILATIGGHNSNHLLDALDFEGLRRTPKILLGYCDFSAVLLAAYSKTRIVSFLGPALLPQFGEKGGLDDYTKDGVLRAVAGKQPIGRIEPSHKIISELLEWDSRDHRPRRMDPHPGPWVVQPGHGTGACIACNLGTLLALAGTQWWPNLDGALLCIEDDEVESPATIEQMLTQLRQIGVFDAVQGLAVGRFHPAVGLSDRALLGPLLLRNVARRDIPIIADLDFGHTDPMVTLPLGPLAEVVADEHVTFSILETGVV